MPLVLGVLLVAAWITFSWFYGAGRGDWVGSRAYTLYQKYGGKVEIILLPMRLLSLAVAGTGMVLIFKYFSWA